MLHTLIFLARKRLEKFGGKIIGVTGTIGKTTTKDAIGHILSQHYRVFKSQASYNSEFGIPLTILGESSPQRAFYLWPLIIIRSVIKLLRPTRKYDFVVLEMGVDKPGDMEDLLSWIHPDIAVMTRIGEKYIEEGRFTSPEHMYADVKKLVEFVAHKHSGLLLLNEDDPYQKEYISSYDKNATLIPYSSEHQCNQSPIIAKADGIHFTVHAVHHHIPLILPILGKWHIEAVLPAILLGFQNNIPAPLLQQGCLSFHMPKGRLNPIPGIRGSIIVDSSYNATPYATKKALEVFLDFPEHRHIFVFGNMNSLEADTERFHRSVGEIIPTYVDILITVGEGPKFAADEAVKHGFLKEKIFHFDDATTAGKFFRNECTGRDVILVKGSQNNVRLEKFIKEVMENPADATKLLVRQSKEWNK